MKTFAGDIIILHKHLTQVYQKSQSYDVQFLTYALRQTEFFVILDHFLLFYPPMDPENLNFEKMKKIPEYMLSFYKCVP